MKRQANVWAGLLLLLAATDSFCAQKFESLQEYGEFTKGKIVLDMAWLEPVVFQGFLNAGAVTSRSSNPVYYDTGIGAAGPAIQILAQAIGTKSARKKKYERAQAEADQVINAHAESISNLTMEDLYFEFKKQAQQKKHSVEVFSPQNKEQKYFLRMQPVFMLSQDQRSLKLLNKIQIHARKRLKKSILKQQFIVVSDLVDAENVHEFWQQENENNMLSLSLKLFEDSVRLVLDELRQAHVAQDKQKTFKYKFGDQTMYERASIVSARTKTGNCPRARIISLGGDIMSLPLLEMDCPTGE